MVDFSDLGRIIDEHPFFADMPKAHRELLVGCASNESFRAGDSVFREGDTADKFYLIRSGSVAIEVHVPAREPLVVQTLDDGDILGWSWLMAPYTWTFDAKALRVSRLIALDAACLRRKMEDDHALAYEMLKRFVPVMGDRLKHARMQMLDMYGSPKDRRAGRNG